MFDMNSSKGYNIKNQKLRNMSFAKSGVNKLQIKHIC